MIFVFKTSVQCKRDVERLKPHLDGLKAQTKWNFDLEDCDNILRVDAPIPDAKEIIHLLRRNGFSCEELPY